MLVALRPGSKTPGRPGAPTAGRLVGRRAQRPSKSDAHLGSSMATACPLSMKSATDFGEFGEVLRKLCMYRSRVLTHFGALDRRVGLGSCPLEVIVSALQG